MRTKMNNEIEKKIAMFKLEQTILSQDKKRYCYRAIKEIINLLEQGKEIPYIPITCRSCNVYKVCINNGNPMLGFGPDIPHELSCEAKISNE